MVDEISFWYGETCIWKNDIYLGDKEIFLSLLKNIDIKYCLNTPQPGFEYDFDIKKSELNDIEIFFRQQFPEQMYPIKELTKLEQDKKNNRITEKKYFEKLIKIGVNTSFLNLLWSLLWNVYQSGYVDKYYNKFMIGEKNLNEIYS